MLRLVIADIGGPDARLCPRALRLLSIAGTRAPVRLFACTVPDPY